MVWPGNAVTLRRCVHASQLCFISILVAFGVLPACSGADVIEPATFDPVGGVPLAVSPADTTLTALGDTVRLIVPAASANRSTSITWHTAASDVVAVSEQGEVVALKPGVALVIAALGTQRDTSVVRVEQVVSMIHLDPDSVHLLEGDSVRLDATALDRRRNVVSASDLTWSSSADRVASLGKSQWVRAHRAGSAHIMVSAEQKSAAAVVTVVRHPGVAARAADAFVNSIGVNVHLSYFSDVYGKAFHSIVRPRLRELGARHLRDSGNVHDSRGWMELTYGRYRQVAEETGARFTLIMGPPAGGNRYGKMDHVRTLLDRIGWDNVEAFEGMNEHDLSGRASWAEEVRTSQRALHRQIKEDVEVARRYPVLGPSLGRDRARQVGNLREYMDFAVMHPYPGGQPPLANVEHNREILRPMNGDRPVVVTETGYHTAMSHRGGHPPVSERAMGRYMSRLFLEYFDAGVVRTFAYELIDMGRDSRQFGQNFGLLRIDGTEKPAFIALRNLIRLLEDPGPDFRPGRLAFELEGDTADVRHLLLQKRDGTFYLALWLAVESYDVRGRKDRNPQTRDLTVRLPSADLTTRTYLPLNGRAPVETHSTDSIVVTVRDHPVILEIGR